jgi:transcriptional regulator with XRE-family HTH domain
MKLNEWIDSRLKTTRHAAYAELAEKSGISVQTIANIDRGMRLNTYSRAKAISDATKGAVTVEELCE